MVQKNKLIIITGATASGKSELAVEIAKLFNGEIISADSVQIYKEFDVGSAKITKEEQRGIKHYNLNIIDACEEYNVANFIEIANKSILEIIDKGKIPIITGGTLMYIKALYEGYTFFESKKNEKLRDIYSKMNTDELYLLLLKKDADKASKIHKNNKQKIIRALEISNSNNLAENNKWLTEKYDILPIFIDIERQILYNKINKRVDLMFANKLVEEVQSLYPKYANTAPLKTIGYKEIINYINGDTNKERTIELIAQHTRNYAKRQITFAKTMPYLIYEHKDNIINKIRSFLYV